MRLVANITILALELKKWPSEVYEQYLKQPQDIELLMLGLDWQNKKDQKELDKMEEERSRIKSQYGR